MKIRRLVLLTIILSLCMIQIQTKSDIGIFDAYEDDENEVNNKEQRCMDKETVDRMGVETTGSDFKDHCLICRADKDEKGFNISSNEVKSEEGALGTYALRPVAKYYNSQIDCQEKLNEDQTQDEFDQEQKIPRCELYDHYGLCVRCMIGFGLQWNTSAKSGEETGAYTCIDNQYRTPYCHKYNSSNECIECKWNQDSEFEKVYTDSNYKLDFALFKPKDSTKTYCVNNDIGNNQEDPQIKDVKNAENIKINLVTNCAEYDQDQKCKKCHTRKFNLEGLRQYGDTHIKMVGEQDESYKKNILDYHLNENDTHTCDELPEWFKTDPRQLKNWVEALNVVDVSKSFCKKDQFLKVGTNLYGCGTEITDCDTYATEWDYDYFQNQGVWIKKITECQLCGVNKTYNTQEKTCVDDNNNCKTSNGNGCITCNDNTQTVYKQIDDQNKYTNVCVTTITTIGNCIDTYLNKSEDTILKCSQCNPGYVIKTFDDSNDECQAIEQYITITVLNQQTSSDEEIQIEFIRGCKKLDKDNKCISEGGFGYNKKVDAQGGTESVREGTCQYGLMHDQMLCKTDGDSIDNCEQYVVVDNKTRCFKCKEDYQINFSGSRCLEKTNTDAQSTFQNVPNCKIMDGPWCQRCQRDVEDDKGGENYHYELSQFNTCIKTSKDNQCVYREYEILDGQNITAKQEGCRLCIDEYYLQGGKCVLRGEYKEEAGKVAILTINNKSGYKKEEGKNTYLFEWEQGQDSTTNCRIYKDTDGNCYECDRINNKLYGVYIDSNNNNKEICKKCEDDEFLREVDGKIICTRDNTFDGVTGCLLVDGTTPDCETCKQGYESNTDKDACVIKTTQADQICQYGLEYKEIASPLTKQCAIKNSYGCSQQNGSSCKVCQHPFILSSGKCVLNIPNCISGDGTNCTVCDPGYELYDGKCLRKSELCNEQNWDISYDPNSLVNPKAHVCKSCFNINGNGNNKDLLRLFMRQDPTSEENKQILNLGCITGCQSEKLKRKMNVRKDSNPYDDDINKYNNFNLWSCEDCRNENHNYLDTENKKQCQPTQTFPNCAQYESITKDGQSKCVECNKLFYLEQTNVCSSCDDVNFCTEFDQSKKQSDGKCTCKKCQDGKKLNNNNTCENEDNVNTIQNCKTLNSDKSQCTLCQDNYYLENATTCSPFTAINCLTKQTDLNECNECIQDYSKTDTNICVKKIENCEEYDLEKNYSECKKCSTEGKTFGLNKDRTECLENVETDDTLRSKQCFQYSGENITKDTKKYPVCIKCHEGYALDYNHVKLDEQCVKAQLCLKAYRDKETLYTDEQTCLECQVRDSDEFVYKTKKDNSGICQITTDAKNIKNCQIYDDYSISQPFCYDCHEGFSPDNNSDGKGSLCVSDYHPGALPGCRFYNEANGDDVNWLKYEWLKCKTCEIEWKFHSAPEETLKRRYNLNTYTRDCDVVESVTLAEIAPNTWTGKDGGLRSTGGTTDDDDTDNPLPEDREQYEDPIIFANILSFSAILILAIATVL